MATQVQYRRGTAVQNASFTGAAGELTIDTTNNIILVQDGSTAGGFPLVGVAATQTLTNKTLTSPAISSPTLSGTATGTANVTITGNITLAGTANVTCGNILNAGSNAAGNIGNSTSYFNTVFAKAQANVQNKS